MTMPPYAAQAHVLRRARERAGKSLQQVGEYLLIGGAAGYEPYERGDLSLSTSRATTLARYFGLDPKAFTAELLSAH
jgi:transcriptional regulator with XRE-family HTH domain